LAEFHDLLPYLLSIGLILTVGYAYIAHLYCGITEFWTVGGKSRQHYFYPLILSISSHPAPLRLSRMIRRKEAPDDDSSDCTTSLIAGMNHQRGGTTWKRSKDSHLRVKEAVCLA